jgi:nitroreductase
MRYVPDSRRTRGLYRPIATVCDPTRYGTIQYSRLPISHQHAPPEPAPVAASRLPPPARHGRPLAGRQRRPWRHRRPRVDERAERGLDAAAQVASARGRQGRRLRAPPPLQAPPVAAGHAHVHRRQPRWKHHPNHDAALQASGLVFNSICASLLLHEPFTRYSLVGTLLVAAGALLIALFGAIAEPSHNLDQLLALLSRTNFLLWMLATAFIVIFLVVANAVLHRIYPRPTPRLRLVRGMFYGCVSGILSAHSLLIAKSAVELLVRTIVDRHNEFDRWQSWMILIGLVVFALTQLYYMHCGLKLCSTSVLYPLVFCIYNIIAIIDGLIYFDQSERLSGLHAGLIALGTVILLAGVVCLSWRLEENEEEPRSPVASKHPGRVPMPQSALEPGIGLLHGNPPDALDSPLDIEREPPGLHGSVAEQSIRRSVDERTPLLRAPTGPALSVTPRPPRPSPIETDRPSARRPARRRRMTISEETSEIWDELNDRDSLPSPLRRSGDLDRRPRSGTLPRPRKNPQSAWLEQMRRKSWFDSISGAGTQRSRSASQGKKRADSSSALLDHPDPQDDDHSDSDLVAHRSGTWGFGDRTTRKADDGPGDWLKLSWWRSKKQRDAEDDEHDDGGRGG